MTDKKNNSQNADAKPAKGIIDSSDSITKENKPASKAGVITGAVAILLTLGLGAGLYYHSHQQNHATVRRLSKQ